MLRLHKLCNYQADWTLSIWKKIFLSALTDNLLWNSWKSATSFVETTWGKYSLHWNSTWTEYRMFCRSNLLNLFSCKKPRQKWKSSFFRNVCYLLFLLMSSTANKMRLWLLLFLSDMPPFSFTCMCVIEKNKTWKTLI